MPNRARVHRAEIDQINALEKELAVRDSQVNTLREALQSETARASLVFKHLERNRAVLIAVRSHFGRDRFHELLPNDLRAHVILEIGDGVQ